MHPLEVAFLAIGVDEVLHAGLLGLLHRRFPAANGDDFAILDQLDLVVEGGVPGAELIGLLPLDQIVGNLVGFLGGHVARVADRHLARPLQIDRAFLEIVEHRAGRALTLGALIVEHERPRHFGRRIGLAELVGEIAEGVGIHRERRAPHLVALGLQLALQIRHLADIRRNARPVRNVLVLDWNDQALLDQRLLDTGEGRDDVETLARVIGRELGQEQARIVLHHGVLHLDAGLRLEGLPITWNHGGRGHQQSNRALLGRLGPPRQPLEHRRRTHDDSPRRGALDEAPPREREIEMFTRSTLGHDVLP